MLIKDFREICSIERNMTRNHFKHNATKCVDIQTTIDIVLGSDLLGRHVAPSTHGLSGGCES